MDISLDQSWYGKAEQLVSRGYIEPTRTLTTMIYMFVSSAGTVAEQRLVHLKS
jgi:hypothetical protein